MGRRKKRKLTKTERYLDNFIRMQDQGFAPRLRALHDGKAYSRSLTVQALKAYRDCPDCQHSPVVEVRFRTSRGQLIRQGLCRRHWSGLAETTVGWSSASGSVTVTELRGGTGS
jgi:hypothetical protein